MFSGRTFPLSQAQSTSSGRATAIRVTRLHLDPRINCNLYWTAASARRLSWLRGQQAWAAKEIRRKCLHERERPERLWHTKAKNTQVLQYWTTCDAQFAHTHLTQFADMHLPQQIVLHIFPHRYESGNNDAQFLRCRWPVCATPAAADLPGR